MHYSLKHPLFGFERHVVLFLYKYKTFSCPGAALLLSSVYFFLSFGKWPHCAECSAKIFISSHVMAGHSCIHTRGFSNIRSEIQRGCPEQTRPGTFLALKTGYYKQIKTPLNHTAFTIPIFLYIHCYFKFIQSQFHQHEENSLRLKNR